MWVYWMIVHGGKSVSAKPNKATKNQGPNKVDCCHDWTLWDISIEYMTELLLVSIVKI